jgi:rare lipoprotein A
MAPVAPSAPIAPDDPAPGERPAAAAGFWLQLGAFRDAGAAQNLQRQLLAAEAPLPGVAVRAEGGLFRVHAGPWPTREAAQQAGAALRRQFALQPLTLQR